MIETKTLLPGVTLRSCRDDRFKQGCLSFQLVRPMAKEESAKNVLIPSVLLRGTKRCPDLRTITENLDELYGASVSPLVRRVGDYQTTGLYCGFMDDRFALPGDRVLKYLRYVVLVGFVIILPLTALDVVGQGSPWYCKYICPSGTLFAGIPLVASNPALQSALGWIFNWKVAILVVLLLLSVVVYRPFCRYLCPLGAIYGLFNPIAFYRYEVDSEKCVDCGLCARACGFGIRIR